MTETMNDNPETSGLGVEDSSVEELQLHPENLVGATVGGRYEIVRCIGVGGMGVVYLAKQTGLGREVVVKVMKANQGADSEAKVRFEREAQGLSKLDHQNIISVYDFGRDGDLYYIAMEYVDGETLSRFMRRRDTMNFATFGPIAVQIVGAIAEAHRNGMIHRDIKPGNIMLCTKQGHPNFVKVLDFGLSKLVNNRNDVTKKTDLVGSASFMAPEQILGDSPVDERVDVYALGVLFFYMLTGKKPFEGDDDVSILYHQVHTQAPSLRDTLPARHDVPEEVIQLIDRCLRKNPVDRPRDAGELILLMRNGVENSSIFNTPWGSPGDFTPFPRPKSASVEMPRPEAAAPSSNKGMIIGLAVVALVGVGAAVFFAMSGGEEAASNAGASVAAVANTAEQAPGAEKKEKDNSGIARGLRVAGLAALEAGDYEEATKNFTRALSMGGAGDDVPELLEIARSLMDKSGTKAAPAAAEQAAPTEVAAANVETKKPEPTKNSAPARRVEPKRNNSPAPSREKEEAAKEEATPMGMMLVASTPNGIVFKLDDSDGGVTPMKVTVPVGTHKISYYKDGNLITTRTVDVKEGKLSIADADIAALIAPKVAEQPKEEPKLAEVKLEEKKEPVEAAATTVASTTTTTKTPKPAESGAVGEIMIQSPNVYGEIFVNGKAVGFPPMVAKGIPVGPAKIEIKVDGNVRRTKMVKVTESKRMTVRM